MSYLRKKEDNVRLKKIYDKTFSGYGSGVYYNETKERLVRLYSSDHVDTKMLKKRTNKITRKKHGIHNKGNYFKKLHSSFIYW